MTHKCIGIKSEVHDLNTAINKEGKTSKNNEWWLNYYHIRLQYRHDIEIGNRDLEIYTLKERIKELEKYEPKDVSLEKVDITLTFNKTSKNKKSQRVTLFSNSKRYIPIYDENGRKWFIPKLNDNSYIKIRFLGKEVYGDTIRGISESSAIIGNTIFSEGTNDVGFILDKISLGFLLIDPTVFFYPLKGTEDIEIVESSNDINVTLEVI